MPGAPTVGFYQAGIGISRLRVFIEEFHIRMSGSAVEIEIVLLDILTVVSFAVGQPKDPFLEDGIFFVPERQCKA
jgi:hypothetical protein